MARNRRQVNVEETRDAKGHRSRRRKIMNKMTVIQAWLTAKAEEDRGAGLAEYALLLFLIAVTALAALGALGDAIVDVYTQITGAL